MMTKRRVLYVVAQAVAGAAFGAVLGLVFVAPFFKSYQEPGLEPDAPRWQREKFPLDLCATQSAVLEYDGPEEPSAEDMALLSRVANKINRRLGFLAYRVNRNSHDGEGACDVSVQFDTTPGDPKQYGCPDEGGSVSFEYHNLGEDGGVDENNDVGSWCHGTSAIAQICNITDPVLRPVVMEHELGHALGLAHDDDVVSSVMRQTNMESPGVTPQISDSDRALLRELYGLRQ